MGAGQAEADKRLTRMMRYAQAQGYPAWDPEKMSYGQWEAGFLEHLAQKKGLSVEEMRPGLVEMGFSPESLDRHLQLSRVKRKEVKHVERREIGGTAGVSNPNWTIITGAVVMTFCLLIGLGIGFTNGRTPMGFSLT